MDPISVIVEISFPIPSTSLRSPELRIPPKVDSLGEDELEVHIPEAILVELLDGGLQPPVRAHEGDGDCYLGVHCAQGPVLQE